MYGVHNIGELGVRSTVMKNLVLCVDPRPRHIGLIREFVEGMKLRMEYE